MPIHFKQPAVVLKAETKSRLLLTFARDNLKNIPFFNIIECLIP